MKTKGYNQNRTSAIEKNLRNSTPKERQAGLWQLCF